MKSVKVFGALMEKMFAPLLDKDDVACKLDMVLLKFLFGFKGFHLGSTVFQARRALLFSRGILGRHRQAQCVTEGV